MKCDTVLNIPGENNFYTREGKTWKKAQRNNGLNGI